MKLRLSLRAKGLLVVSAILLMESLLVGRLVFLLYVTEDQLAREQHTQKVIYHLNREANLMQRMTIEFIRFVVTKESETTSRQVEISKALSREFVKLEKLLKDDADGLAAVLDLKNTLATSDDVMLKCRQLWFEGKQLEHLQLAAKLHTISDRCSRKCDRIVDAFIDREFKDHENRLKLRGDVENWLKVVAGANGVLCIALVLWFSATVTRPLATIVDNMKRLAEGKPLNRLLASKDELGSVDSTFHSMAEELEAARQRKKEMVAMVSHDLRTPLTSVNGILDLLETGRVDPTTPEGLRTIRIAQINSSRLLNLVNDLLDIEKLETGTLEMDLDCVDLNYIIEKSVASVFGICQNKDVTISTNPTTLQVIADADRCVQVLTNLLSNAVKYSPSGSVVRLDAEQSDGFAEIKVSDQGSGIPEEFFEYIFIPFRQLNVSDGKRGVGTGLGLAISKAIIEAHNGTIGVTSQVGEGSTFWFKIPLTDPDGI